MRKQRITAVIAAGGTGLRFGGDTPKQFVMLGGKPILARTLSVFEQQEDVTDIIVTVPAAYVTSVWESIVRVYGLRKVTHVVPGGVNRQSSVYNALCAVDPETDIVLIHDGARPFVTERLIADVIRQVGAEAAIDTDGNGGSYGAVCAGIPASDTVKLADAKGFVLSTPDRETVWLAQTPQGFTYGLIMRAHEQARDAPGATDDAVLAERLGVPVRMMPGDVRNIKITTRADMAIAESFLEGEYI